MRRRQKFAVGFNTYGISTFSNNGGVANVVAQKLGTCAKVASVNLVKTCLNEAPINAARLNRTFAKFASPSRAKTHPGEVAASQRQPEDLMQAYLYLMGPDSREVSGTVIAC